MHVGPGGEHTDDNLIFAAAPDAFVMRAADQCRWEDVRCWEGLRSR